MAKVALSGHRLLTEKQVDKMMEKKTDNKMGGN